MISKEDRIARVAHMTELYEELTAYYESPDWMEDFEAERNDFFPKEMNREILTEDAIYDLICEVEGINEKNNILLINDIAGYGKVALSAMIPILSHMKFQVYNLPTAVVSNTLDYGKFEILDTTDYMKNTIKVWEALEFHFDAICTGFITSVEQAELVYEYCCKQKELGTTIIVDPIMGDGGKLYNGIGMDRVECMTKLCAVADIIVPNITEACFMTGVPVRESYTHDEIQEIFDKLFEMGTGAVVVTSLPYDNGESVVPNTVLMMADDEDFVALPYEEIPVRFPGTGDIFTSIVAGRMLRGADMDSAVKSAMNVVEFLIRKNEENVDKYKGIPIERYLDEIVYE